MKKLLLCAILMCFVFGCTATISDPRHGTGLNATLVPKDYNILGEIRLTGKKGRGIKYIDLIDEAKKKYDADDVINISLDTEGDEKQGPKTYTMRGLAIKYK